MAFLKRLCGVDRGLPVILSLVMRLAMAVPEAMGVGAYDFVEAVHRRMPTCKTRGQAAAADVDNRALGGRLSADRVLRKH